MLEDKKKKKNTVSNAELFIPIKIRCKDCKHIHNLERSGFISGSDFYCRNCHSGNLEIIYGYK